MRQMRNGGVPSTPSVAEWVRREVVDGEGRRGTSEREPGASLSADARHALRAPRPFHPRRRSRAQRLHCLEGRRTMERFYTKTTGGTLYGRYYDDRGKRRLVCLKTRDKRVAE